MNEIIKIAMQADVRSVVDGFNEADTAGKKFGATLNALHVAGRTVGSIFDATVHKIKSFGIKMGAAGTSIITSFAGSVKAAAGFEAGMNNVNSIMLSGKGNVDKMGAAVLRMSTQGVQSADSLVKGLYNVASAGYKGADALTVLDVSQKAATAGLTNVDTASNVIIGTMRAYGKGVGSAKNVSDELFQSVNLGIFTFEQLAQSMGEVIPMAAAAKVSVKEVGGALATMTRGGLQPAEASTSLSRLIQFMVKPSKELAQSYKQLGINSGPAALAGDGLYKTLMKLKDASGGNLSTLLAWFPEIRAARGAMALMAGSGKDYTEVMHGMNKATQGQGATQKAFNEQMRSLSNQWQQDQNKIKAFFIELGQSALPIVHWLQQIMDMGINMLSIFDNVPTGIKEFGAGIALVSGLMLILGGAFLAFKAKGLVTRYAFKGIAAGLASIAPEAMKADGALAKLHSRLDSSRSLMGFAVPHPFQAIRNFAGIGASQNAAQRIGDKLIASSYKMSGQWAVEQAAKGYTTQLGPVATATNRVGQAMKSAGTAANGFKDKLAASMRGVASSGAVVNSVITAVISLGMAWRFTANAADDAVAKSLKGFKQGDLNSTTKHINDLGKLNNAANKSIDALKSPDKFVNGVGLQIADLVTNGLGFDSIKDSPVDQWTKAGKSLKEYNKLVGQQQNIAKNIAKINYDRTGQYELWSSMDLTSKKVQGVAKAATAMGFDLSKAFSKSAGARKAIVEGLNQAEAAAGTFGKKLSNVTTEEIARVAALQKEMGKLSQAVGTTYMQELDLTKAYDPNRRDTIDLVDPNVKGKKGHEYTQGVKITKVKGDLIPAEQQIADYYLKALDNAATFTEDLNTVISKGLNPQAVVDITKQGPAAAGKALHQVVQNQSGALIDIMNHSYDAMGKLADRGIAYSRIAFLATQDLTGKLTKDYSKAAAVQSAIFAQDGRATTKSVARALSSQGFTTGDIARINKEFALGLVDKLRFQLPDGWEKHAFGTVAEIVPGTDSLSGPRRRAEGLPYTGASVKQTSSDIPRSAWMKQKVSDIYQGEFQALLDMTTVDPEQLQRIMIDKLSGKKKDLQSALQALPEGQAAAVIGVIAAWKEDPKLVVTSFIGRMKSIPDAAKSVILNTVLGVNGKPMTLRSVRDLQLHYGIKDRDLKVMIKLAEAAGVPGATEVLGKLDREVGKVRYVHIKLVHDGDPAKELNSFLKNSLPGGMNGANRQKVGMLTTSVESGDWKRASAEAKRLHDSGLLSDQVYTTTIRIIRSGETSGKLDAFLSTLNKLPEEKDTIIKALNVPGALANIGKLQEQLGLTPEEVLTTLGIIGTPEAVQGIETYIAQLKLTPKQVKTFLKTIDDPKVRNEVAAWFAKHNGDTAHGFINVNADQALIAIQLFQDRLNGIKPVKYVDIVVGGALGNLTVPGVVKGAIGGLMSYYAQGGMSDDPHVAQVAPAGTWRVWAEPETGGEAYIPLAQSKRGRSTKVLGEVANRFGMQLIPAHSLAHMNGGVSSYGGSHSGPGLQLRVEGSSIVVQGNADKGLLRDVKTMMDDRDRKIAQSVRAKTGRW